MSRWAAAVWLAAAAAAEPEPAPAEEPGVFEQMWRRIRENRVPLVRTDGSPVHPLGPAAAALAFGGVVLAIGGVGALVMWRASSPGAPRPQGRSAE